MFLVNTVALVEQQAAVLERHLLVSKVGQYSGDMNVDFWNMAMWKEEFEKFKVSNDSKIYLKHGSGQ